MNQPPPAMQSAQRHDHKHDHEHEQDAGFRHDALFYAGDEEFTAGLVPFIRDGLERNHAVVAAVTGPNLQLLRDALGGDARHVNLIDRQEWYVRPAATVTGWQRLLDEALDRGHPYVRIIGEVAFGETSHRQITWTRYEAALNRLFAAAPSWIICPYDERALPPAVLADARRTHPAVSDPGRRDSEHYLAPEQLLAIVPEVLPPLPGNPILDLVLADAWDLAAARRTISAFSAHWPAERVDRFLMAISEVAANALRHGDGERRLRLWELGHELVCEISDQGPGLSDPLAGYSRPSEQLAPSGWGLWIAGQLCDTVALGAPGDTRVRITVSLTGA